jgi:hypothetical protein
MQRYVRCALPNNGREAHVNFLFGCRHVVTTELLGNTLFRANGIPASEGPGSIFTVQSQFLTKAIPTALLLCRWGVGVSNGMD